jgi:hypothetical protein
MATIAIENPYKLDGLINGDTRYMIRYEGKNLSHPNDNYSWIVLNVLGNHGRLIIERDISHAFQIPSVKSFWSGNEKGEEWLNIDKIKEPQWVMAYMLDCIDGKFDK